MTEDKKPLYPSPRYEKPEVTEKKEEKEEKAALEKKQEAEPKTASLPWVPDLTDFPNPPWHAQNRGNAGYRPWFQGDPNSPEGVAATRTMASGDYTLPAACYDNVTGNPSFQAPRVQNPPYRWDTTGRQVQWVRP